MLLLVTSPFASVLLVLMVSDVLFLCSGLLFTFIWSWLPCCMFEQPPSFFLFFWHSLSKLSFCCSRVLKCLDCLFSLMKPMHSSMLSWSSMFSRWCLHVSTWDTYQTWGSHVWKLAKACLYTEIIYSVLGNTQITENRHTHIIQCWQRNKSWQLNRAWHR